MAECVEIDWADGTILAILGIVRDWEEVKAGARSVEPIEELSGWQEFRSVYRVEPMGGGAQHFLVADD